MNNAGNLDILNCLANLSSDEVFTSPELANKMIDLLPQEIFKKPDTTFLDPSSKSGVFLREIAKRLIEGLKDIFPNKQERIDHIMAKQLFALSITQLTAETSRRTLYCSRNASGKYSITNSFKKPQSKNGNIKYQNLEHNFNKKGNCTFCKASEKEYSRNTLSSASELENHAYLFIHKKDPKEIFKMKFDVIIGNPPYHLKDGGAQSSAKSIYQYFIENAKKLQPNYLCMIVPARWYAGGKGLDSFRKVMISDNHITKLYDFPNSADCFPTLGDKSIKGGVCYFLWEKNKEDMCEIHQILEGKEVSFSKRFLKEKWSDVFVRDFQGVEILKKIRKKKENTFNNLVSSRNPFGMGTNFQNFSSNKNDLSLFAKNKGKHYVSKDFVKKNKLWIDKWKIIIPKAVGVADVHSDKINLIFSPPNSVCTETYIVVKPFNTKENLYNCASYIETKFFHYLLSLRKVTQDTTQKTYSFIPLQDFSESWDDQKLYKKYNLSQEEIEHIEKTVWSNKKDK